MWQTEQPSRVLGALHRLFQLLLLRALRVVFGERFKPVELNAESVGQSLSLPTVQFVPTVIDKSQPIELIRSSSVTRTFGSSFWCSTHGPILVGRYHWKGYHWKYD